MIELRLEGWTYNVKEELKAQGFKWNPYCKAWTKRFEDSESEQAKRLSTAYEANGVYGSVKAVADNKPVKHYMVKEDWISNLESMHDKLFVIEMDLREGALQFPLEVAGKEIKDYDDLDDLANEAAGLEWKAKSNKGVTGAEYGRIKEIVSWRVMQRYTTCLAAGMEESKAAMCFQDM